MFRRFKIKITENAYALRTQINGVKEICGGKPPKECKPEEMLDAWDHFKGPEPLPAIPRIRIHKSVDKLKKQSKCCKFW